MRRRRLCVDIILLRLLPLLATRPALAVTALLLPQAVWPLAVLVPDALADGVRQANRQARARNVTIELSERLARRVHGVKVDPPMPANPPMPVAQEVDAEDVPLVVAEDLAQLVLVALHAEEVELRVRLVRAARGAAHVALREVEAEAARAELERVLEVRVHGLLGGLEVLELDVAEAAGGAVGGDARASVLDLAERAEDLEHLLLCGLEGNVADEEALLGLSKLLVRYSPLVSKKYVGTSITTHRALLTPSAAAAVSSPRCPQTLACCTAPVLAAAVAVGSR